MKYKIIRIMTALSLTLLTACSESGGTERGATEPQPVREGQSGGAVQTIDAKEAKRMMDEENVTIVDVRTEEEYQTSHIPGAVLVPNETIEKEPLEALPDQSAALLVYCRTGIRAADASEKLSRMGYEAVYNFGGITTWPYETVAGSEEE